MFYICVRMDKKITIIDVARLAGVSKGTVDRVVHNRGEVSEKSAKKVRQAIEELQYEPNLYASLLASKKSREIACILPRYSSGEYWEKIDQGIAEGDRQVSALNVHARTYYYDQYDLRSFREVCDEVIGSSPSGVILPPLFRSETMNFVNTLYRLDIPYIFVDTKLEDCNYLAYFGMPSYKSGYLCAELLTLRESNVEKIAIVRIKRDKTGLSDPTASRREGFLDYISEHFPDCEVSSVFIDPSTPELITPVLDDFFSKNPGIKHMVMFNSRVHLLADFLSSHPEPGRRIIGFDSLDKNMEILKDGTIDALIAQHTENQSFRAVVSLADYILVHKSPALRDNYVHMDILTRLNIENY